MSTNINFSSRRGFGVYDAVTRMFDASHQNSMQKRAINANAKERDKDRMARLEQAEIAANAQKRVAEMQSAVREAEIEANCRIASVQAEARKYHDELVYKAKLDRHRSDVEIAEWNYKASREAGMGALELQYATEDRRRREAEEEERQGGVVRDFTGQRINGVYNGEYLRKVPHGQGDFYYDDNRRYIGGFAAGRFEGEGEWYDENGILIYKGQWAAGRFNGTGRLRVSDSECFVGTFRGGRFLKGSFVVDTDTSRPDEADDMLFHITDRFSPERGEYDYEGEHKGTVPHGRGMKKYANGDYEEGTYVDGKAEGMIVRSRGGRIYIGMVKNDVADGPGQLKLADGTIIDGDFVNGELRGRTTAYAPDGSVFEGDWHQEGDTLVMEGKALMTDGRAIDGTFHDLKAFGTCHMHDAEGYDFTGTFADNRPLTGKATQAFPDGTKVELTINDGKVKRNMTTYPDGAVFIGKWAGGQWKSGTLRLPDGTSYTGAFRNFRPAGHVFVTTPTGQQIEQNF